MEQNLSKQAANIVLGEAGDGEKFSVKTWLFTFKFQIRPIKSKNIVRISRETSRIKNIDPDTKYFPGIFEHADDLKYIWRAIAIAALDSSWKIYLFKRIVSRMIGKAEPENMERLWDIVKLQSDPERFFFIMASAKGFNKLLTKNPKEEIPGLAE